MGLDFDVTEFIKELKKQHLSIFTCPIEQCQKSYKSIIGLTYHLSNYDHDNPGAPNGPGSPRIFTPIRKRGRGIRGMIGTPKSAALSNPPKEVFFCFFFQVTFNMS
jgi:bromodomain and PHD finger-containing protein 1